jgi:hypothetical protein
MNGMGIHQQATDGYEVIDEQLLLHDKGSRKLRRRHGDDGGNSM